MGVSNYYPQRPLTNHRKHIDAIGQYTQALIDVIDPPLLWNYSPFRDLVDASFDHRRRPLHRRLHRRRRRQRRIPGKRITPPPRRTPLLLPDGRNPRPSPGPEKRNPGSQPMTDADRLINPIQFLAKRSHYDLRADQASNVFPSPPALHRHTGPLPLHDPFPKTPPQSHTTTDLQPNLQHVPPTPKTRRLRSAPATRYQPPESTRSHILTNRLISYLNSSPHSHPEAPMSTTNSHLQKILAQAEQELTAADYNNTELDPEIEAVPKHQVHLSIQATQ